GIVRAQHPLRLLALVGPVARLRRALPRESADAGLLSLDLAQPRSLPGDVLNGLRGRPRVALRGRPPPPRAPPRAHDRRVAPRGGGVDGFRPVPLAGEPLAPLHGGGPPAVGPPRGGASPREAEPDDRARLGPGGGASGGGGIGRRARDHALPPGAARRAAARARPHRRAPALPRRDQPHRRPPRRRPGRGAVVA